MFDDRSIDNELARRDGASPATISDLLVDAAGRVGERDLLRFEGRSLSGTDLLRRVGGVAAALQANGVMPGERVAIMLPNGLDLPVVWLGIVCAGAVAVPINVQYRTADIAHVIADAEPMLVVAQDEQVDVIEGSFGAAGRSPRIVAPSALTVPEDRALPSLEGRLSLANLQYTSGTTGLPKGCMLTHEYWLQLAHAIAEHVQLSADDVVLTAQSFSYLDPQWNLLACLVAGATLVIAPRFSASTFWSTVREEQVTFVYTIGAMPVLLLKQPPDPRDRDHRVRLVLCSGIVAELHDKLEQRWGVPWREAFGMTETGADLAVPIEDGSSVGSGAVGRPLPPKTALIVGDAGREVSEGEVGELVIGGGAPMVGYWRDAAATAATLRADGVHTGDLAFIGADGYVHLVGRKKDMVRRGGENVAAVEVEGVLCGHDAVRNAAVVPVADPLRGEEVRAVIELADPAASRDRALAEMIRDSVGRRLAAFKVPRYVTLAGELPLTPSGRVIKRDLPGLEDPLCPTFDLGGDR